MIEDSRPILMIDGKNLFIRHYVIHPDMTTQGTQIGGVVGSLKAIRRVVSDFAPKRVFVAWEGGGSTRRRALFAGYKANRKPERLNRFYTDDIPDSEDNRVWQQAVLAKLLRRLPIVQLYVSDCEGDDVIAYLHRLYSMERKIIVSNDRDFYQLLDDKTSIWSPQTKRIHTADDVSKEHHGIRPRNFALAKAICGDPSDNIPGVRGLGFKTLAKRIPIVIDDHDVTIDEVLDYCRVRRQEAKVMQNVVDDEATLRLNWRLVYLGGCLMSCDQEAKIDSRLAEPLPDLDALSFMRDLTEFGVRSIVDPYGFCSSFVGLTLKVPRSQT